MWWPAFLITICQVSMARVAYISKLETMRWLALVMAGLRGVRCANLGLPRELS